MDWEDRGVHMNLRRGGEKKGVSKGRTLVPPDIPRERNSRGGKKVIYGTQG